MSRKFYLNSISISFKLIHNFRSRCSCGNSFLYKIASSSKCSKTCSGNSNQNCGSKWLYFSVFRERDNTSTISDSLVVPISNMSASQISQILSQDKIKNFANVLAYCFSRDSVFEPLAIFRDISDCYYYDDIIFWLSCSNVVSKFELLSL